MILNDRRGGEETKHWQLCFGKRSQEELYDIKNDFYNVHNLAAGPEYAELKQQMKEELFSIALTPPICKYPT